MSLIRAALGWPQIAGLGISLVIAGQFTGWNYGLQAGWANLVVATVLMAILCFGLALCVAELSAARPHAGGLYAYCQDAFGRFVGYLVGVAVFIALSIGTGAAATFISAYCTHVLGFGGTWLKLMLFAVIAVVHLRGIGEAMRWMVAAGVLSVVCIVLFLIGMAPHFSLQNLATPELPLSVTPAGVFSCVPFAIWLFISIEQSAAASEEVEDPGRAIPRGMLVAIGTLLVSAIGILLLAVGGGGINHLATADDPLFAALTSPLAGGASPLLAKVVGVGGMLGLVATMFSLVYSASRQLYALARDGHLPAFVGNTNRRSAPYLTIMLVALIGVFAASVSPDRILLCVVLSLAASYVVLLAAFIQQRTAHPNLARPFRAWGGRATAAVCLLLALLVLSASFQSDPVALGGLGLLFGAALLVHFLYRGTRTRQQSTESGLADV
ncbi:amino acid permease [Steroidobacter sp.]|uniref:amino acid permease n=1 Tax=Steroidobacter sp. TaxID=1978227 RepID=UPI001A373D6D|nr:amino acid permease [Steroidobacter sp.]MBL8268444.1 amino acid permease [Steroidobacter sp.]